MGQFTAVEVMKPLVFATNNLKKTEEVRAILLPDYQVLNLNDIGCLVDIPETGNSFAENATLKSSYVVEHYKIDCFGDDSGLEVEALNNEPGIFSARYSGSRGDEINLNYLLAKMEKISNRKARFKTVISLMQNGQNHLFEGVINGELLTQPVGTMGFGYDPIFIPNGYTKTFAQMTLEKKNEISHRAIAMRKLITFLKESV
jgi:XTP/dITP diphosphohydrolase